VRFFEFRIERPISRWRGLGSIYPRNMIYRMARRSQKGFPLGFGCMRGAVEVDELVARSEVVSDSQRDERNYDGLMFISTP
jgi:hypothetical protein